MDINTDQNNDVTDNNDQINLQTIHKTLLLNLKNEFNESIKPKKLAIRVAKLQKKSNNANNKFNDKYLIELSSTVDGYKTICEQNESLISNEMSINEKIEELSKSISNKQHSIKRLATSINECAERLKLIDIEEERANHLLLLLNNETQLLTHLKTNFEKNVNFVKQQLQ